MAHLITVKCPLGNDVFGFRSMSGEERLSSPFRYEVMLLSEKRDVKPGALLGQPMTIEVAFEHRPARYYNGIVTHFGYVGEAGRYTAYRATLRPWLYLLTRTANSRIFQNKSVPDILKEIFRDHAFSDFEEKIAGTYKPRTYCVQYRESDFNFVSRLMEHEGIYYFADHEDGKHSLVLFDSQAAHEKVAGYERLPYLPHSSAEASEESSFTSWSHTEAVQPGSYALRDYDFLKPNADLTVKTTVTNDFAHGEFEVYDYPGSYTQAGDGEKIARVRIEAMKAEQGLASATHTAIGLYPGSLVQLTGYYPRPMEDGEYLVVGQRFDLVGGTFETSARGDTRYSCDAVLLKSKIPFSPPRTTPVPTVQGPQTATIAGKSGSEVWTDEHGRVKLKFHWDREGDGGEQSSCWVRVSQNSASSGWGSMYVPHVGDEVIVEFLEGDPDQPIVVGRVYNANRMPPLTLPANDRKSIFRDHYGNEMVFDGTAGQEHISLHSPSKFSVLQVGKSVRTFTGSTQVTYSAKAKRSYTLGDGWSFTRGASYSVTRGGWFNVKFGAGADVGLGASCSVWGGLKISFAAGVSIDVTKTSKLTYTWDNQWNAAKGNLSVRSEKNVLVDSQKKLMMTGGKDDNSLIVADGESLTLSYDPDNKGRDMTKLGGKAIAIAAGSSAVLAAAAGLSTWSYSAMTSKQAERVNGTTVEIDAEVAQLEAFSTGDIAAYGGVVAGVLAAHFVGKPSDAADPGHRSPTSAVELRKDVTEVYAGKGRTTRMVLKKDNGFTLETDKNIMLDSEGAIAYKAKKNIDITANQTNFDAIIKHKNLTVLK